MSLALIRDVTLASAAVVLLTACSGSGNALKGEIRDDKIILSSDHAGHDVWVELHNVGGTSCDIFPALTSLPMDALPVKDGRVVIDQSGAPGTVRPLDAGVTLNGGQAQPGGGDPGTAAGYLARVQPGDTALMQLALEGTPNTEDRIILCVGAGDYERGRYGVLKFDR